MEFSKQKPLPALIFLWVSPAISVLLYPQTIFGQFWKLQCFISNTNNNMYILATEELAVYNGHLFIQATQYCPCSHMKLSTSCQSSSQITAHIPSVNSPFNYLIPTLYVFIYFFILVLCTPVSLLAHSSSAHLPIQCFNCAIVITSPPWPIYFLILPHLHSLYIDFLFSFVLLYY